LPERQLELALALGRRGKRQRQLALAGFLRLAFAWA
jgi:hypothetical protein